MCVICFFFSLSLLFLSSFVSISDRRTHHGGAGAQHVIHAIFARAFRSLDALNSSLRRKMSSLHVQSAFTITHHQVCVATSGILSRSTIADDLDVLLRSASRLCTRRRRWRCQRMGAVAQRDNCCTMQSEPRFHCCCRRCRCRCRRRCVQFSDERTARANRIVWSTRQ